MNKESWYYQYTVKVWDDDEKKENYYSGLVPAKSAAKAVKYLEEYYADGLMDILGLKAIVDGPVFEFNSASKFTDCDFTFCRKL